MYTLSSIFVSLYFGLVVAQNNSTSTTSTKTPTTSSSTFTPLDPAFVTGDHKCTPLLCVTATVNGSSVEYALQSTGAAGLGWMAMGFGDTMANTPMVIMWPNADGSITLSQRKTPIKMMPTVDDNPPRVATLVKSLSSATNDTKPKFVYSIPSNGDKSQWIIWAFGGTNPNSSAVDATLQWHLNSGTIHLDLTGTIPSNTSPDSSNKLPLAPYQRIIVAHGIFCTLGFVFFLPTGALVARYFRNFTPKWVTGHWTIQFFIAGPTIVIGIALAIRATVLTGGPHFNDKHKQYGIAIFILYLVQLSLGAFVHFVRDKDGITRSPQKYIHALVGTSIIALGFYQVRQGFTEEWATITRRQPAGKAAIIIWYIWVVVFPLLYLTGFVLEREERSIKKPQRPQENAIKLSDRDIKRLPRETQDDEYTLSDRKAEYL